MDHEIRLAESVILLSREAHDFTQEFKHAMARLGSLCELATKHDLRETKETIMSAIGDFAASVQQSFDAISTDLDTITAGITSLDALITQLQNSPGSITPQDQALLDQIQTNVKALKEKADAVNVAPPVPPVTPS